MSAEAFLLSHYSFSPPNIPRRNFNVHSFYYTSGSGRGRGRGRGRGPFRFGEGHLTKRNNNSWKLWADVKSKPFKIADDTLLRKKEDGDNLVGLPLPWWEEFPKRWVIVILCFSAFLLCNMDRVNMTIAILPMASEYNWSPTTVGLIQSSFFWGYLLTQIAGGIWADTVGGKAVLGFGVVWWSVATVLTPIAAKLGLPFLFVVRAFMGIGEGVAMPAMNNILSKWVPVSERSRSLALVYSGMYLGSVTGLAFSPFLIHKFGWPSVFFSFGSLGTVWFAVWLSKAYSSPLDDPRLRPEEKKLILSCSVSKEPVKSIPWKLILSKPPVWALIVSHFCHNWGTFILLIWMPTYYHQYIFIFEKKCCKQIRTPSGDQICPSSPLSQIRFKPQNRKDQSSIFMGTSSHVFEFHQVYTLTSLEKGGICRHQNFVGLYKVLKFNLTESGLFAVLPWLTMAVTANIGEERHISDCCQKNYANNRISWTCFLFNPVEPC